MNGTPDGQYTPYFSSKLANCGTKDYNIRTPGPNQCIQPSDAQQLSLVIPPDDIRVVAESAAGALMIEEFLGTATAEDAVGGNIAVEREEASSCVERLGSSFADVIAIHPLYIGGCGGR